MYQQHLLELQQALADYRPADLDALENELHERQSSAKRAADELLTAATEAIRGVDFHRAVALLKQYLASGPLAEHDRAKSLLRQCLAARPAALVDQISKLSTDQQATVAASGKLPSEIEFGFPVDDPLVLEALGKIARQIAFLSSAAKTDRQYRELIQQGYDTQDLRLLRKDSFLSDVALAYVDRDLTPARVRTLLASFGGFATADLEPLLARLPADVRLLKKIESGDAAESVAKPVFTMRDLYHRCRELAGEAWIKADASHPLAGHWTDRGRWHLYIDPDNDSVAFTRKPGASPVFRQDICKIGPDYIVAYETLVGRDLRENPRRADRDPFAGEKTNDLDHLPLSMRLKDYTGIPRELDRALGLTMYRLSTAEKTIQIARRWKDPIDLWGSMYSEDGREWAEIGDAAGYRELGAKYQFVDSQVAP